MEIIFIIVFIASVVCIFVISNKVDKVIDKLDDAPYLDHNVRKLRMMKDIGVLTDSELEDIMSKYRGKKIREKRDEIIKFIEQLRENELVNDELHNEIKERVVKSDILSKI